MTKQHLFNGLLAEQEYRGWNDTRKANHSVF